MTIHVTPHLGVEVVVPRRTPAREVQRFVSKHLDWIEETEEELANTTPAFDRGLPLEIVLPAIDQVWRVSYRRTPERKLRLCERPGNVLELSGPVQDEEACRVRLRQWLTEIARETLAPWLERISERTGLVATARCRSAGSARAGGAARRSARSASTTACSFSPVRSYATCSCTSSVTRAT